MKKFALITSIVTLVTLNVQAAPLGAAVGGVLGAAIGNQIGGGNGKMIATAAGAAIGATVGNDLTNPKPVPAPAPAPVVQAPPPVVAQPAPQPVYLAPAPVQPMPVPVHTYTCDIKNGVVYQKIGYSNSGYYRASSQISACAAAQAAVRLCQNDPQARNSKSECLYPTNYYTTRVSCVDERGYGAAISDCQLDGYQQSVGAPPPVQNDFLASVRTSTFSRQSGGSWVQILFSDYSELTDLSLTAVGRDVIIHEVQLIDQNNELIQVNEMSEVRIRKGVKTLASELIDNDMLKGINIRAESMGGPASLSVKTHSSRSIQLSNRY